MGLFNFLFGKKKTTSETKETVKKSKEKTASKSKIKASESKTESLVEGYNYINSKGKTYYLNSKDITLKSTGRVQTIYWFSNEKRSTGCDLPEGKVVYENPETYFPMLKSGTVAVNKPSTRQKEESTIVKEKPEVTTKKKIKKSKSLEITNEEMCNLKDEETYLDKDEKPFTGILFSKATGDEGRIQCEYKNGKRHGEYIEFDSKDENKITHTKHYKNGLLHGKYTYWYEKFKDGKQPAEEEKNLFEDNPEIAAMFQQITKKHDVMKQINYKDGLLHGKLTDYNWNGGINHELNFKEGKKDGVWRLYFQTPMGTGQGGLKKISIYKDDKHISSKYYDLDNEELSKEDALNDEEWGGEGWEDDVDFSSLNHI